LWLVCFVAKEGYRYYTAPQRNNQEYIAMSDIATAVTDLLKDGYAYIPVDALAVANAQKAAQRLLRSIGSDESWSITRRGEDEPDLGVISKSKQQGYDEKSYFHFAVDLPILAPRNITKQQRACLMLIERVYHALKMESSNIISELVRREELPIEQLDILGSFRLQRPYSTSVLRFLNYPDTPQQTGAKDHFDKSFLTLHLGDDGGELYVQDTTGAWVLASPPQGMALVFFGVKALYASDGALKPLRHRSTTEPGKVRTAAVLFVHTNLDIEVKDAQRAYDEFYAQ
jgi:2OG-Fe(II) oxygenase superfamily